MAQIGGNHKSQHVMNSAFLKYTEGRNRIPELGWSQPTLPFYGTLLQCLTFYKEHCIQKAIERRLFEFELRQKEERFVTDLHAGPGILTSRNKLQGLSSR